MRYADFKINDFFIRLSQTECVETEELSPAQGSTIKLKRTRKKRRRRGRVKITINLSEFVGLRYCTKRAEI